MSYRNAGNAERVRRAAGLAYHLASTHGRGAGAAFFTKTIGRRGEQGLQAATHACHRLLARVIGTCRAAW